ncbi:DarT ssDNA thymidine ADP-ribosyltransferase family protein [Providencia rettgeri]|uniref:DarT ssDNA thymidine ADP-ribosyltransferase family protein n=1 Tax=Providencia rettgeri TaxID=587 RepID=UPI001EE6EC5E|nr:DarT ssDNA thymidine ADP-ribosyltransferase family protein [Providencia rettgeri]MCG5278761.1 DUF4433 domain-containing protein [Providencia rettgeri]
MASDTRIQDQQLLYHLTSMDNLPNILENGLCSRESLGNRFIDVADGKIIQGRGVLNLQQMVPFHFFGNNPFDGRVKTDHKDKNFCMITVNRRIAKENGWKIIPIHPLSANQSIELMDYDAGFDKINWDLMNKRDYKDPNCKLVCMAECLSPITVPVKDFHCFFVKDDSARSHVLKLLDKYKLSIRVNINVSMC